jgi:hypothetical protein
MDFERRIQEAKQHVDQTKGAWDAAKKETGIAQSDYDTSFSTAPNYQTYYEKYKQDFQNSDEILGLKSTWQQTKDTVDTIRTTIDKLPESIGQMFGGTSLTQAQRDMAKQQQLQQLNKSFTQYNANYQTQFADYNKRVDDAFDQALDVANKDYDSYWDGVRRKFDVWQTSIKNEEQWSSMYYTSQSQLSKVESDYRIWQIQQETIRMQREFEEWQNNFAAQQRASTASAKKAAADWAENQARKDREANQRFATDTALFQQGKLSVNEYMRRMDAGLYRT